MIYGFLAKQPWFVTLTNRLDLAPHDFLLISKQK